MNDTSDTGATRVRNFDFGNNTSESIFSHPYVSYMANERLQGEEQFDELPFGNASFPCQNVFEKCTTKTELCIGKSISIKVKSAWVVFEILFTSALICI